MPIYELPAHQSNLTEQQQKEALAAAYSLPGVSMSPAELSYEERVKMRRVLDEMDAKEAGSHKEFDLNKPPAPPYHFQEYPFLMYHHATKATKAAINHEHRMQLRAQGWSEDPVPIEAGPAVELSITERMEIEDIDRRLKQPKESEQIADLQAQIEELKARLAAQQQAEPEPEMAMAGAGADKPKPKGKRSKA